MSEPTQRIIEANGIRINIAEKGEGPLVLLAHGFPESWYSWRRQIDAIAAAGFHVVAPDMRGYGKTDAPEAIDQYTIFHLVGDMVGILDALKAPTAVIVGHDWGANVAWQAALMRPDRFRGVAALSVPFRPRGKARPTSVMPRAENAQFYQLYFQEPGLAEAEFGRDPRRTIRSMLFGASGDGAAAARAAAAAGGPRRASEWCKRVAASCKVRHAGDIARLDHRERSRFLWRRIQAHRLPRRSQLLSQPRSQLGNQGLTCRRQVTIPALYVAGDRDFVVSFPGTDQLLANLKNFVPNLRGIQMLPGCGHWTQQERPNEVSTAIIDFMRALPSRS